MEFAALIDAIVRQTTVLIAQLATAAGIRAPLSHIANQVFLDLVRELEAQGLGRKVVADMFGIALRSYQRKVRRLTESTTDRNETLWSAVLDFVQTEQVVSRARVACRFSADDPDVLGAVLHDLVESGLVYHTGRGASSVFRAASTEEIGEATRGEAIESEAAFVHVAVYRMQPVGVTALANETRLSPERVREALAWLEDQARIERVPELEPGAETWRATTCLLPTGTTVGWEAALFHHYQAMVVAICTKLQSGTTRSLPAKDIVGGSTYEYLIWDGHPMADEIYAQLREVRAKASDLRARLTAYNEQVGRPEDPTRITFYTGQSVVLGGEDEEGAQ